MKVHISLQATDAAGQTGESAPLTIELPHRVFTEPLAQSLIEQRKNLAMGGEKSREKVNTAVDALSLGPEQFFKTDFGNYLAMRSLNHRLEAPKDDPGAKSAFAVVSIVCALLGSGAWSLVIGSYASITTELVLSWWFAKWRPFQGRFSYRLWREMAGFSLPLMFQGMAESIRDTFQQVLVGRALGTPGLGQYRYGYRLALMPAQASAEIFDGGTKKFTLTTALGKLPDAPAVLIYTRPATLTLTLAGFADRTVVQQAAASAGSHPATTTATTP